jgi:23S rRNA (guanosine2251-2'-O)-methyltransferase
MRPKRTTEAPLVVAGVNAVLELLRSRAPLLRLVVGPGPRRAELLAESARHGVRSEDGDRATLDRLAGGPGHQGVVAQVPPFRYAALEAITGTPASLVLVLDGVQDPRNFGAILRSARAAGVGGVVVPQDRSVGVTPVVVTASAGTAFGLPIARVPNLVRAMTQLRDAGFWLVGLSPAAQESLYALSLPDRLALIVGGEGGGLRPLVRRTCDFDGRIPMAPGVESLNVSVATAVALFELRRRAGQMR